MLDLSSHPFFFSRVKRRSKLSQASMVFLWLWTIWSSKIISPNPWLQFSQLLSQSEYHTCQCSLLHGSQWELIVDVSTVLLEPMKYLFWKKRVNFFIGFYFCLAYWSLQGLEQHILMEWARQATWLWSSRRGSRALPDWSHCNTED